MDKHETCNHVFAGNKRITCGQPNGHRGLHSHYGDGAKPGSFTYCEWNDKGQTAPKEIGRVFPVDFSYGRGIKEELMLLAIEDAERTLGRGVVFEIRGKSIPDDNGGFNYGRGSKTRRELEKEWGLAWYCVVDINEGFESHRLKQEPLFVNSIDNPIVEKLGGYLLFARVMS